MSRQRIAGSQFRRRRPGTAGGRAHVRPPRGGGDAEDANDGSVSMRWDFPSAEVLTLADLGERGQMRIAASRALWWGEAQRRVPLVLKVSHHGSADQYPELIEWLHPSIATVSAGIGNPYGHPTRRTLDLLASIDAVTLRTDELGSIAIVRKAGGGIGWNVTGR